MYDIHEQHEPNEWTSRLSQRLLLDGQAQYLPQPLQVAETNPLPHPTRCRYAHTPNFADHVSAAALAAVAYNYNIATDSSNTSSFPSSLPHSLSLSHSHSYPDSYPHLLHSSQTEQPLQLHLAEQQHQRIYHHHHHFEHLPQDPHPNQTTHLRNPPHSHHKHYIHIHHNLPEMGSESSEPLDMEPVPSSPLIPMATSTPMVITTVGGDELALNSPCPDRQNTVSRQSNSTEEGNYASTGSISGGNVTSISDQFSDEDMFKMDYRSMSYQQLVLRNQSSYPITQLRSTLPVSRRLDFTAPSDDNTHLELQQPTEPHEQSDQMVASPLTSATSDDEYTPSVATKNRQQKRQRKRRSKSTSSGINKKKDKPVYRRRARLPRSRNGCWTCRCRRKKCDETKPGCNTCKLLGIDCAGYANERPDFMTDQAASEAYRAQISESIRAAKARKRLHDS